MSKLEEMQLRIKKQEQKKQNKKKQYKKLMIALVIIAVAIPGALCISLIAKVTGLEDKVVELNQQKEEEKQKTLAAKENGETKAVEAAISEAEAAAFGNPSVEAGTLPVTDSDAQCEEEQTSNGVKKIYLTFDDGPSINTDEILDILAKENVKATFFVVGKDDADSIARYQRIVNEGHSIGIHSYSHEYSKIYASMDNYIEDINKLSDLIYNATGIRTSLYRFPGGSNNTVSSIPLDKCKEYLQSKGYTYFDWNALNGDAVNKGLSVKQLISNIMGSVEKNTDSVVLMHDLATHHNTVESLEPLIDKLKKGGYEMDVINMSTPACQFKQ